MDIFITGVTGFLGGELLVDLSKRTDIDSIFCLVRSASEENALARLKKVFRLHNDPFDGSKIIPIVGDLADDYLAESLRADSRLNGVSIIIHSAANTSFSKIYDSLVEKINIDGLKQILLWAQSLRDLSLFTYVGTATICGSTVKNHVTEEMSPDVSARHLVKYSYTKMIGELLLKEYLPEDKTLVVRPSIIMGDSREWVPRSYVILWALATLNELRLIPANGHSKIDIVPVDYVSQSIIQLVFNKSRKYLVYHISSGEKACSTPSLSTDAIKEGFPEKPPFRFVDKKILADMKKWTKDTAILSDDSPLLNFKNYLDYWVENFEGNTNLRILLYALEPYISFIELNQVFDNSRLLEDTTMTQSVPAHIYLKTAGKYLDGINVFEGAIDP